jgi:hypothetical protein
MPIVSSAAGYESSLRIRILQEPSPLMLGAAHLTMKEHFDMDEIFSQLVSTAGNKGKTRVGTDSSSLRLAPWLTIA